MKKLGGLLLGLVLVSGCGTTGGSVDADPPSGDNTGKAASSAKAKPKGKPGIDTPLKFGQAFTWKGGLTMKIGKPKPFKPSEYAYTGKGKNHVVFPVTVVNKTGKAFDPALIYITLQSGNKEAQELFDGEKGLNGAPATKVLSGREAAYKIGFTVKNPQDLVLEGSPDAGIVYESVLWQRGA